MLPVHAGHWPANIHTAYRLCTDLFNNIKTLELLTLKTLSRLLRSGSTQFAQAYLSENWGSLQYILASACHEGRSESVW